MMTAKEIERRMPLWVALSDLFLDTEPQDFTYQHIDRVRMEAGFTLAETRDILAHEVYPAFAWNLSLVAGEWALFPEDEVRRNVLRTVNRPRWLRWLNSKPDQRFLESCWSDFLRHTGQS